MIRSFDALLSAVQGLPPRRVVVAGATKAPIFEALEGAVARGLVEPVLVGPEAKVRGHLDARRWTARVEVVDEPGDDGAVARRAVAEVRAGRAELLMKGSVATAALLSAVLDEKAGLRRGERLSHVAVVEAGDYGRLQLHTDGGINLVQDLAVRKELLLHAVELCQSLGVDHPNIAGLALVEAANPKLPETLEMAELRDWVNGGGLGIEAVMEGPVGLDIALSARAAEMKGFASKIAGQTDVFLGPNITAVNFTVKGLIELGGARVGGLVLGAKVPIVLLSRSDGPETRLLSLALAVQHDRTR